MAREPAQTIAETPTQPTSVPFGLTLGAIGLGFFMVLVDTTITLVAVPAIGRDLGGSAADLQWSINAYTLVFASMLLTGGSLGDRFGARNVFVTGVILFGGASVLCATAPSLNWLIAARAMKGLGAAALLPTSLSLLSSSFPDPQRRARAYGAWSGIAALALVAGPTIGGPLVDVAGWRSVFWVNVPIGATALLLTLICIPNRPARSTRALDLPGQGLAILTLGSLVTGLIEGERLGWSAAWILVAFAAASFGLVAFVLVEHRRGFDRAMLPLELLLRPGIATPIVIGLLYNFAFYGLQFLLSFAFQNRQGSSATTVSLLLLPISVTCAVFAFSAGKIVIRFGRRVPIALGMAVAAIGALVLTVAGLSDATIIVCGVLIGFGAGVLVAPLTSSVMEAAPAGHAGVAAGMLNAARQSGGVLGIAVLGAVSGQDLAAARLQSALALVSAAFASASLLGWRVLPADAPARSATRSPGN